MSPVLWFVAALCGWILSEQDDVIAFLRGESSVAGAAAWRRLQLSDEERRRLAVLGHQLGRAALARSRPSPRQTRFSAGTASCRHADVRRYDGEPAVLVSRQPFGL